MYLESRTGITIKLSNIFTKLPTDIILYFVYLPNINSPFYDQYDTKRLRLLEDDLDNMFNTHNDSSLILIGDLNAKCGELTECAGSVDDLLPLQEYNEFFCSSK